MIPRTGGTKGGSSGLGEGGININIDPADVSVNVGCGSTRGGGCDCTWAEGGGGSSPGTEPAVPVTEHHKLSGLQGGAFDSNDEYYHLSEDEKLKVVYKNDDGKIPEFVLPDMNIFYRGVFMNSAELAAAHPTDEPGAYASVTETNSMWLWSEPDGWKDSTLSGLFVENVNGKPGPAVLLNYHDVGAAAEDHLHRMKDIVDFVDWDGNGNAPIPVHESLGELQGGADNEHYHVTEIQHNMILGLLGMYDILELKQEIIESNVMDEREPVKVTISAPSTYIEKGKSVQFSAIVTPVNTENRKIVWSSSNDAVATVSSTGVVKGTGDGSALIVASREEGGESASCEVNVSTVIRATSIYLQDSATIWAGNSAQLSYSVTPSTATNRKIRWTSSNSGVASVNGYGQITGVTGDPGDGFLAVITMELEDGSLPPVICYVRVKRKSYATAS